MRLSDAIDAFVADMRAEGRMNSDATERNYRIALNWHADDVDDRDPRWTDREDVKRTLARWPNANTRRKNRSILVAFYDWTMQELEPGRKDNPARQTRAPKARKPQIYRMTRSEVVAFLAAATTIRERRVAFLGVCAGLRNYELRHLQRRHFERAGWVHVSADIGKGGRERWVPVLPELEPVVAEILRTVGPTAWVPGRGGRPGAWVGEYVLPAERWRDPGVNTRRIDIKLQPASRQVLRTVVEELGRRAGIHAHITPHLMRHAFGDHVARYAGIKNAQALLGHADVGTTQSYTGAPTLDELEAAIRGYVFDDSRITNPQIPLKAPTGIEPVEGPSRPVEPNPDAFLGRLTRELARLRPTIEIYADALGGGR
jgi:site-specific recombinase XerD